MSPEAQDTAAPVDFSIIVPTYNRRDFIRATVASALTQTHASFEVIVVDDGSTDGTPELFKDWKAPGLRYFRRSNAERGASRNFGVQMARGQYVTFLDSDDRLLPHHLATAAQMVERHARPEVFHLAYRIVTPELHQVEEVTDFPVTVNERLLRGNCLSVNGIFLRRDVALQEPFSEVRELSGSEDWQLYLRLAARYPIFCSPTVTSLIIAHDGRSVVNFSEERLKKRMAALLETLREDQVFLAKFGGQMRIVEGRALSYVALHVALKGQRRESLAYLRRALSANYAELFSRRFLATVKHVALGR